jgi:predicted GNAT family acetyltransferase
VGDFDNGDITITCNMNANPSVTRYIFYSGSTVLQDSSSSTYTVTASQGYGTYSCTAQNTRGTSSSQSLVVEEETIGDLCTI